MSTIAAGGGGRKKCTSKGAPLPAAVATLDQIHAAGITTSGWLCKGSVQITPTSGRTHPAAAGLPTVSPAGHNGTDVPRGQAAYIVNIGSSKPWPGLTPTQPAHSQANPSVSGTIPRA